MRAPPFWWRPPGLLATLLSPLGGIYGAITAARMARAGASATVPVICIGNLTAGGTGKTPTAIHVAERLRALGRRPVFLTRGYGGRTVGPTTVDPARHGPDDVGDEPLLLAATAPTVVARDRVAGAAAAAMLGDVVIMDDGLQNPALHKTFALAVVDGAVGFGNGRCIPAGPLRAPVADQLPFVDAFVVIGPNETADVSQEWGKPVLTGALVPDPAVAAILAGRDVFAFAGIGRPEKFFATLRTVGATVLRTRALPDHHVYARDDVEALLREAERKGLVPVTTAKDMVKIRALDPDLAGRMTMLPATFAPDDPPAFDALLLRALKGAA